MSTTINLTYCGMEGNGATVKLAKQDAARKIETALDGHYTPVAICHAGRIAIVARHPKTGWGYRFLHCEEGKPIQSLYMNSSADGSEDGAINAAIYHLAQQAGHYRGLEPRLTAAEMRDLDGYNRWQADYARLRSEGKTDVEAHQLACGG